MFGKLKLWHYLFCRQNPAELQNERKRGCCSYPDISESKSLSFQLFEIRTFGLLYFVFVRWDFTESEQNQREIPVEKISYATNESTLPDSG